MTEIYEDGNYLVRVRAQVMTRDDSSGGWVPLGGGGLSNLSVRKRIITSSSSSSSTTAQKNNKNHSERSSMTSASGVTTVILHRNGSAITKEPTQQLPPSSPSAVSPRRHSSTGDTDILSINNNAAGQPAVAKHEYFIFGKRISDQSVVLSCTIKKDFEYNIVMPTFHHWRTEDKKFGLTFQTAADARAFDKGVRTAVEDLLDGLAGSYPSSPIYKYSKEKDLGDEDVFMTLNLPIEAGSVVGTEPRHKEGTPRRGVQSSQSIISRDVGMAPHHRLHYSPISRDIPQMPSSKDIKAESYSYVQLTPPHDYIYPLVEESKSLRSAASTPQSSIETLKKRQLEMMPIQLSSLPPKLPSPGSKTPTSTKFKKAKIMRIRCRYCNEYYSEEENPKGGCEFAPDAIKTGIEKIACMNCAQCLVYHCMSDAEGDFATQPCACNSFDRGCVTRWIGVTLLSFIVPCLWCYPPLRACHKCGVCCGLCGGQHSPAYD